MSTVQGTSSTATSGTPPVGGSTSGGAGTRSLGAAGIDKDAFMKLLVAQLRMQNPLSPLDNEAFIAQMTQFATLEQVQAVAASSARVERAEAQQLAISLIGKTVTYGPENERQSGRVVRVELADDGPALVLDNGGRTSLERVVGVSP